MVNNLQKFQIDNIKIEAWATHETEEFLQKIKICADLNFCFIDLKFQEVVDKYMTYNLLMFQIANIKIVFIPTFHMCFKQYY